MVAMIPAAGHGTRFAPFTKLVPKEMLPIGARPAIALIVDEAVGAGADEIIIITSPEKPLLKRWFEIEPPKVKISWVDQLEQHGLGHAVLQAEGKVRSKSEEVGSVDDKILILLGDALVSGCNASAEMVALSRANGNASVIGCEHVPPEKVSRYGILKLEDSLSAVQPSTSNLQPSPATRRVVDLVEKPALEEAPSNLAIAGRYLLSTDIFDYLSTQAPGKGGEIQLTDAIRRMITPVNPATPQPRNSAISQASKLPNLLLPYVYPGKRLDIGNPDGYFNALEAFLK